MTPASLVRLNSPSSGASWRRVIAFFLLQFAAWCGPALLLRGAAAQTPSQPAASPPFALALHAGQAELILPRAAQILEDPNHALTLPALLSGAQRWTAYQRDIFNFGFSRSTWWARVRVRNADAVAQDRVLDLGSALQDRLDAYVVRTDGTLVRHVESGDRRPFFNRPVATRRPTLALHLAPGETLDIYLQLGTHDGLHEAIALKLWEPAAYASNQQTETLAFGLYYGALITVLLYNLFLFASTRQRSFGIYTAYVTAFFLWSFTFRGYAFQYLWPNSPVFNNQMLPVAAAACYCTFGAFTVVYLGTRETTPRWLHRTLVGATVGNFLCITPAFFNYYALSFAVSIPFGVTLMMAALCTAILLLRAGSRPARYFMLAFTLLALGVMLYYARVLGWVPSNVFTENFLQMGSAAEVILLAFGLADQMNELKAGRLRAERALKEGLEREVQERTRELEAANQRLADMSITDELTGVHNRRHFNAVLDNELARHLRTRTPLALCLFDVDHFKLYNDRYGHPAGDAVLKRVAQVARQRLRRAGDAVFRVGGEEFALLFSVDESPDKMGVLAEQVRAGIEALAMAHAATPAGVVTASFGLVVLTSDFSTPPTAQAFYAAADELLYAAKHQGRNRVVKRKWMATDVVEA